MKCLQALLILASCFFLAGTELAGPTVSVAKPNERQTKINQDSGLELTPEQELAAIQKSMIADRPYQINHGGIRELFVLNVLPTTVPSSDAPDWWSDKQGYDIAFLFALALSKYPAFKVLPPETWGARTLRLEVERSGASPAMDAPVTDQQNRVSVLGSSAILGHKELTARLDILGYGFQHMPVKRRGIGIGIVALNAKECSTETYLKSNVLLGLPDTDLKPVQASTLEALGVSEGESLVVDRLIVDKTGGASLNLNFIIGGAGGGSFAPPEMPLKKIIYETVADAAEATFCLATNQEQCIQHYRTRTQNSLTKLTAKQKQKVGSC